MQSEKCKSLKTSAFTTSEQSIIRITFMYWLFRIFITIVKVKFLKLVFYKYFIDLLLLLNFIFKWSSHEIVFHCLIKLINYTSAPLTPIFEAFL